MVTPLEIKKKEFRRCFRGYDDQEVDTFLDQVAAAMETLLKKNNELKEAVERAEQNIFNYQEIENALKQTMVFAQKTAQEVKENAQKEADVIHREARTAAEAIRHEAAQKAESVLEESRRKAEDITLQAHRQADQSLEAAHRQVDELLQEYRQLKKRVKAFRDQFRSFLETQLELLDDQEHGVAREMKLVISEESGEVESNAGGAEPDVGETEPQPENRQLKPIAGGKS